MQLAIYNQLKARISTLQALKYVALWNNQFEREDVNVPFNYPCCFIEFPAADYIENLQGQQQGTMTIALHLGFESYKTEYRCIRWAWSGDVYNRKVVCLEWVKVVRK